MVHATAAAFSAFALSRGGQRRLGTRLGALPDQGARPWGRTRWVALAGAS